MSGKRCPTLCSIAPDEIETVDLPPDELLERFREGKVYVPDQVQRAIDRFFRKETLVALREPPSAAPQSM